MKQRERLNLGFNNRISEKIVYQVGYDLLNHLYVKLYKQLNGSVAMKLRNYLSEKTPK